MADIPMKRAVIGSKTYEIVDEYARENIGENKDILMGLYPIETASGPIAVIHDGADSLPVRDLSVAIEPVQTGTGTPSPSNVRAITGWSAVKVARTSRNLLPKEYTETVFSRNGITFTVNADGSLTANGTATAPKYFMYSGWEYDTLPFMHRPGLRLRLSGSYPGVMTRLQTRPSGSSTTTTIATDTGAGAEFTVPDDVMAYALFITVTTGQTLTNATFYPVISMADEGQPIWSPSEADTHTIDLPTTVYGGTLDVTKGILTVTKGLIASYAGETLPGAWISDRDVYAAGATPTTGAQVVYNLATPQTYTLTPVQVKTLLGENRIYADAGQVTVQYRADFNEAGLMYIPKAPTADGSYRLTADVNGGTPTYRWEIE
jgi:hypothetical protein